MNGHPDRSTDTLPAADRSLLESAEARLLRFFAADPGALGRILGIADDACSRGTAPAPPDLDDTPR